MALHFLSSGARYLTSEKVERFMFAGAAPGLVVGIPRLESAPVNIKRLELDRSPDRLAYGR
jgi:hypothetical protein